MNIPENILQAVADAAFAEPFEPWLSARAYHLPDWKNQEYARRAVIQHALSNPALAPFLAALPAAEATPPVQAKHAAQVPLGPEDVPPGSVIRGQNWAIDWGKCWLAVLETTPTGVHCNRGDEYRFTSLHFGWQINTSIPDTGRWDANAWKPCSKPGK